MGLHSLFKRKKKSPLGAPTLNAGADIPVVSRSSSENAKTFQIEELEEVFKKFDANGDGKISSSELASILTSLGCGTTEEELKKIVAAADKDGDGLIDFDEFVELNTEGIDSEELMENLREAFSIYDINGDGSISAEELQNVMKSLGEKCSLAECRRMISAVDANGDGVICFEEFKVMMEAGSGRDLKQLISKVNVD